MEKQKLKLQKCKDHAISKGGLCISNKYTNNSTKMLWKCKEGHKWEACWNSVKDMNSWCSICSYKEMHEKQKIQIHILQNYAKNKNGRLISTQYINSKTKVLWECEFNHQWEATWNDLQNGWCPHCLKTPLTTLQQHAILRNGKLISTKYINNKTNLIWECDKQHQWEATWGNIKYHNTWCPYCSSFTTEKQCREIFENIFNVKFKKKRFYYGDQKLEFDGYNKELNIGFEYHGEQHYEIVRCWQTTDSFKQLQIRDDFKEQYALEHDVKLIIIPYTEKDNLHNFILNKLESYALT